MLNSFLWILIVIVIAGLFSSAVTIPGVIGWYPSLRKPVGTPPEWLFGIIWPIMYTLLILSTYFGYESQFDTPVRGWIIINFTLIAILIALWSYVFFYMRNIKGGLIVILLLLFTSIYQFWTLSAYANNPIAGALLLPVVLWLLYATYLNMGVVVLNPTNNTTSTCGDVNEQIE